MLQNHHIQLSLQEINFTFRKFSLALFQPLLDHFLFMLLIVKDSLFTSQLLVKTRAIDFT